MFPEVFEEGEKKKKKVNIPFFRFIAIVAIITTFKKEHISTCNNNRKIMTDTTFCKTLSVTDALRDELEALVLTKTVQNAGQKFSNTLAFHCSLGEPVILEIVLVKISVGASSTVS